MAAFKEDYRGLKGASGLLIGLSIFAAAIYPQLVGAAGGDRSQLLDGLWFVVQTVTTTGYGSLPEAAWTIPLKVASIVLMVAAAPLWSFILAELIEIARRATLRRL